MKLFHYAAYLFHSLMRRLHKRKGSWQTQRFGYHHHMRKHYKSLLALTVVLFFFLQTPTKADYQTEEQQTIQTAQKLLAATVKVMPDPTTDGTGFYIARDSILTNEHVIHQAASDTVHIKRYDGISCTAHIGYREEGTDLAILHTDCLSDHFLTVTEGYKIGQSIVVVGNPGSFDFTVSKGIVSAYNYDMIQFDARIDYGSSGGVVADLSGNVIGVVKSKWRLDNYVNFAIPGNRVKQFLNRAGIKGSD